MVGRKGVLRSLSNRQSKGACRGARGEVLLSFDREDDELGEGNWLTYRLVRRQSQGCLVHRWVLG